MEKAGVYTIKEQFFTDMSDPYLKINKAGHRPHYYCFEDDVTGLYWMIPLSSRVDKYRGIMERKAKAGIPCDALHIIRMDNDRESVFLIQDMFPITEDYIDKEYTIAGNPLKLTSEHAVDEIDRKARHVLAMLRRGVKFTPTQPDVMAILRKLQKTDVASDTATIIEPEETEKDMVNTAVIKATSELNVEHVKSLLNNDVPEQTIAASFGLSIEQVRQQ